MGQKINPTGFRLGITQDWKSKWFARKDQYGDLIVEDKKIRDFLQKKFDTAGLKDIKIERSPNEVKITVRVSKPGIVIGKGGAGVEQIQKEMKSLTNSKVSITAEAVKTPEIEAQLVADYIARQIKRRTPYRRLMVSAAQSAMDKGAKGVRIQMAGLLGGGNSIARKESHSLGAVPTQTLRADIDYAQVNCNTIYGTVGIKVWIYKGEVEL